MKKILLTIGLVLSLVGLAGVRAQDIISDEDTIFSSPEIDGTICYIEYNPPQGHPFLVTTNPPDIVIGDGMGFAPEILRWSGRGYISFDQTNVPENITIQNATLKIYQFESMGNNVEGRFPVWDVPGGDTLFCIVDHINYGDSLDSLDWSAGDEGDPQTLNSNIGIISKDSAIGWKTLEVTPYVQDDVNSKRGRSQFRIRFPIIWDGYDNDWLRFYSGDYPTNKPCLIINYKIGIEEKKRNLQLNLNILTSSQGITVNYSLPFRSKVVLKIYDLLGREIRTLVNENKTEGDYRVIWDGKNKNSKSASSGIYFCQLVTKNFEVTKRVTILR